MPRKIRSDSKLKTISEKFGIPEDSFRNPDGRKTRNDKLLKNMRNDSKKKK